MGRTLCSMPVILVCRSVLLLAKSYKTIVFYYLSKPPTSLPDQLQWIFCFHLCICLAEIMSIYLVSTEIMCLTVR